MSEADIDWADVIFAMEEKHHSRLRADFGASLADKRVHVLDIPDEYKYMDPELVNVCEQSVGAILVLN